LAQAALTPSANGMGQLKLWRWTTPLSFRESSHFPCISVLSVFIFHLRSSLASFPLCLVYLRLGHCPGVLPFPEPVLTENSYAEQDITVSAGTHTTTAMSSWRVLTSVRLARLASAPSSQTCAPGTLLQTRSGSSYAKKDQQHNKNDQNKNNGQKAAIALASATALALKVLYDEQGISLQAETSPDDYAHENRVRMYMAPDKIFNYFASFQLISGSGNSRPDSFLEMTRNIHCHSSGFITINRNYLKCMIFNFRRRYIELYDA